MASLPMNILYDILKNTDNVDFKDVQETSPAFKSLLQQVIQSRKLVFNAVYTPVGYYYYNETARVEEEHELTDHFGSLSEGQQKDLGELKITSPDDYSDEESKVYRLEELLARGKKFQFETLSIENYSGSVEDMHFVFKTDFKSISIVDSKIDHANQSFELLRSPLLKNLTIRDATLPQDFESELVRFLNDMQWESVELEKIGIPMISTADSAYTRKIENLMAAWQTAKNPQAKLLKSEFRMTGQWDSTLERLADLGKRNEEGSIVMKHEKKDLEALVSVQNDYEGDRIVIEFKSTH